MKGQLHNFTYMRYLKQIHRNRMYNGACQQLRIRRYEALLGTKFQFDEIKMFCK